MIFFSYLEGVQVDFQRLAEWTTFENISDYEDLISRYNLFDQYVQQSKLIFFMFIKIVNLILTFSHEDAANFCWTTNDLQQCLDECCNRTIGGTYKQSSCWIYILWTIQEYVRSVHMIHKWTSTAVHGRLAKCVF